MDIDKILAGVSQDIAALGQVRPEEQAAIYYLESRMRGVVQKERAMATGVLTRDGKLNPTELRRQSLRLGSI
jgi:hypothetical protein